MIVVDASLASKWFLNEPDSARARTFFADKKGQLCGPDLLAIEVSRALVAAANARRVTSDQVRAAITVWLASISARAIELHALEPRLIMSGADIALNIGHPLADCLYLALAIELGCDLATCDVKFRDKAAPHYRQIRLLAEVA